MVLLFQHLNTTGGSAAARRQMKETALIRAAHNGHLHTVKYLLERGADVNAVDLVRVTADVPVPDASAALLAAS